MYTQIIRSRCAIDNKEVEQPMPVLHLLVDKIRGYYFANSSKAGLYFFRILAATKSIFSSSVMPIMGELSRSSIIYLGRLFLKITAWPFFSAIRVTRENSDSLPSQRRSCSYRRSWEHLHKLLYTQIGEIQPTTLWIHGRVHCGKSPTALSLIWSWCRSGSLFR